MRIFLTGANGFIGGAAAAALIADGHTVRGLVRDKAKGAVVATYGIEPVIVGSLSFFGASGATTLDAAVVVVAEPSALVAVTIPRRVCPTSSWPSLRFTASAPAIVAHSAPDALQSSHL